METIGVSNYSSIAKIYFIKADMIVVKKNYIYKVIYKSDNIKELESKIEELAYEYLLTLEVKPEIYLKKSKSKKFGYHPFGYFMIAHHNRINIYHKYINRGWLTNSVEVDKLITFILIKPCLVRNINLEIDERISDSNTIKQWADIHEEILKKVKTDLDVKKE